MKTSLSSPRGGLILLASAGISSAQNLTLPGTQIAWASDAFATNLMADGITTFEASGKTIHFELGAFASGFDPGSATPEALILNWTPIQSTHYDPDDQQFIQTADLLNNDAPFTFGGQAYIWGYTSRDLENDAEWLIVGAAEWTWPSASAPLPTTFSMGDASPGEALVGAVNSGSFHMKLGSVTATAIPEPAAPLLLAAAAFAFGTRRNRTRC